MNHNDQMADESIINMINIVLEESPKSFIDLYLDRYLDLPTSISGKYHKHEPKMMIHILRTLFFTDKLIRNFRPKNEKEVILGAFFHDIGKVVTYSKGKNSSGKYYPETGYTRLKSKYDHGKCGAKLLSLYNFPDSVCLMVENHMSHWEGKTPEGIDQIIVSSADYLASREDIMVDLGGTIKMEKNIRDTVKMSVQPEESKCPVCGCTDLRPLAYMTKEKAFRCFKCGNIIAAKSHSFFSKEGGWSKCR